MGAKPRAKAADCERVQRVSRDESGIRTGLAESLDRLAWSIEVGRRETAGTSRNAISACKRYRICWCGPDDALIFVAWRVGRKPALLYTRDKAEAKRVCEEDLCGSR